MSVVLDLRAATRGHRLALEAPFELLASARATWRGRMIQEHGSAHVFEAIADQMLEAGFRIEDVEECRRFAAEERHHGVLCGAVLESLGGEAIAEIDEAIPVPDHDDVSRTEAVVRNLVSVSCLSETIAVSLIGAERMEMPRGPLHDLLTRIWADEVGHARFGWRIVNEQARCLGHAARRRTNVYLAVAFAHLEQHELSHLPLIAPPAGGAALGLCNGADARSLFYDTIEQVIVPRLEAVGLDARWAWRAAQTTEALRGAA